jgi:filamentous hemagglutinin family protein
MPSLRHLLPVLAVALPLQAQITPDGSLGTNVSGGPNVSITGGTTRGNNLFHSFSQFNIASGESATFNGAAGTRNVLARVTGGQASAINGTLRCDIAGANLFLINPRGVSFGPGAALDVSGNFAATTADFVRLADGGRFDATNPNQSNLTAADPVAFGFLGGSSRGSISVSAAALTQTDNRELMLVGGDIELSNGFVQGLSGSIGLAAVGQSGQSVQVPAGVNSLASAPHRYAGTVGVRNASRVRVSGDPSNRVVIRAGRLVVDRSSIDALASNVPGGNVAIEADRVIVRDQGIIGVSAPPGSTGDAGRVDIRVHQQLLITNTSEQAKGGEDRVTGISAQSQPAVGGSPAALGAAGEVNVDARGGSVVLTNEGVISSTSFTTGAGGSVDVVADRVFIDGAGTRDIFFTGILARTKASSPGGRVNVVADTLDIRNGGRIATSTINLGRAGQLAVTARLIDVTRGGRIESTSIADPDPNQPNNPRGRAGKLDITATELLTIERGGVISVETDVEGDGGAMILSAPRIVLADGGSITSRSTGDGVAGRIVLNAGQRIDVRDATISASSLFRESGDITLQATREIEIVGSRITNRAVFGDGGNINLFAIDSIRIIDSRIIGRAGVQGGQITIDPKNVLLQNSIINGKSDTSPESEVGPAASRDVLVIIIADNFIQSNDSLILTERQQFERSDVSGQIVRVSAPLGGRQLQLDDACSLQNLTDVSTLTQIGRGGIAPDPSGWVSPMLSK